MGDSQSIMRVQRRKKQQAAQYLGGKCILCGYSRCLAALEFHHTDPAIKEQKMTYIVYRWSWERVVPELKKCILVCSNCHRELHFGMCTVEEVQERHRTLLEKECQACKELFRTRILEQIYCSDRCRKLGQRKVPRPSGEQLAQDMLSSNWTEIGRKYGVTNAAVKKWARQYGLL